MFRRLSPERIVLRLHALRGIVISRWFLFGGMSILGVVLHVVGIGATTIHPFALAGLVSIGAIYNGFCSWYVFRHRIPTDHSIRAVTLLQVICDQLFITVAVFLSGGVESVAYLLYFFPILTTTILYSDIFILAFALVTNLLYAAMVTLEYQGVLPHQGHIVNSVYGHLEATVGNTLTVNLILLLLSLFAVFVNRIIYDRETLLAVERDKIRTILQSLEDGIVMLDPQKKVLLMNPPARDILHLYNTSIQVLRKDHFSPAFAPLLQLIREQKPTKQLGQEVCLVEDDTTTYIQVDSLPIQSVAGEVVGWVKVLRDVTREKELEEVKSDFISIAAHQLRTPLAALKWFFKIMSEGDAGPVSAKQQDLLHKAYDRNNQVIEIVNNLLNISEIEQGRFPYEFANTDIVALVKKEVEHAQLDADHQQQTVELNVKGDIPLVEIDRQKMHMCIQNLLDNALKYSPPATTVKVSVAVKNNCVFLSVADAGIGIPQEQQKKIFSKFFRGKNAKEFVTSGSGLGLYIVKNVVHKHRGHIWFSSTIGKGTTFYISLPIGKQQLKTA